MAFSFFFVVSVKHCDVFVSKEVGTRVCLIEVKEGGEGGFWGFAEGGRGALRPHNALAILQVHTDSVHLENGLAGS